MATYYWTKEQRTIANIVYMCPITGFDTNDGSANAPKKTFSGVGTTKSVALPSCTLESQAVQSGQILYGSGNTKLVNCSMLSTGNRYNIHTINCTFGVSISQNWYDCIIDGGTSLFRGLQKCVLNNITQTALGSVNYYVTNGNIYYNSSVNFECTFSNLNIVVITNNIFDNCQIRLNTNFPGINNFRGNMIARNCTIAIGTGEYKTISQIESETGLTGIAAIEAAYKAVFTSGVLSSQYNYIADPLFVDAANGNFSVFSDSPAIGLGYSTLLNIGNVKVGRKINIVSDSKQLTSCIDTESAVNATFVTDQISSDSVNDMVVKSQIIEFSDIVEVGKIVANYTDSQSTGELLDTQLPYDIAAPISAGTALEDAQLYVVRTTSITYASVVRTVGAIFKASGTDSFTGSGVVHKITELPNYKTFGMRWSNNSGNELSAGDTLTEGAEYLVKYDTITYDGVERPIGSSFCCKMGITTIIGVGKVVEIFTDLDAFSQFLLNKKPAVKRIGDIETGSIQYTNGQKEYHSSENDARTDFYIKAKFIQLLFSTKTNSLK